MRLGDLDALTAIVRRNLMPNVDADGTVAVEDAERHFLKMIETAPTIDAVPVVRCKDCKHKTVTSEGMVCERALPTKHITDYYIYGSVILASVKADDFCSHGDRREENADN